MTQTILIYDGGKQTHQPLPLKLYAHGEEIVVTPPVIETEGGYVTAYDVLTRTELSDELVILQVAP